MISNSDFLHAIQRICPTADISLSGPYATLSPAVFKRYGMTTLLEWVLYTGQIAHETAGFKTLKEYGNSKYFRKYDTRTDLGNTPAIDGDGELYKGRGYIMTTGKHGYDLLKAHYPDMIKDPDDLEIPKIALEAAGFEYKKRKLKHVIKKALLNDMELRTAISTFTRKINGGFNGAQERQRYTLQLVAFFKSKNYSLDEVL